MNTRFDAMSPRPKKDGGTFWVRVGTGWQSEKGMQIVLDALPIPDSEGRVVINLFEPRDRDAPRQPSSDTRQRQTTPALADLDDEAPF